MTGGHDTAGRLWKKGKPPKHVEKRFKGRLGSGTKRWQGRERDAAELVGICSGGREGGRRREEGGRRRKREGIREGA